jgi:small subunit ribosomal protein S8
MSMQDPISDMLTQIRNAQMIGIKTIGLAYSNLKNQILEVLKSEGYIEDFEMIANDNKKDVKITLKYYQNKPVIEKIKRVSKPALRIYRGYQELPLVRGGLGIAIVSTPKGVMTDKAARANKLGGEVLCTVE